MTSENRVDLQNGYVLHQRAYRDTSALVEIFTLDFGRVSLLAKGAKRRKGNAASLQPFSPVLVSWQGGGELKTLTQIEQKTAPLVFSQVDLISALYLNELLVRVLPKFDPVEELFFSYQETLDILSRGQSVSQALRQFEKKLLASLGYELNLTTEVDTGNNVQPDVRYAFVVDHGPIKATLQHAGQQHLFLGKTLLAIAEDNYLEKSTLEAAKLINRLALKPLLGNQPLKTRELLLSLNQKKAGSHSYNPG